jgi:hypothetical protein
VAASDYEAIRTENIARYGWDTAVLELLGQLYSDRTHFIFELIQNAEDAGAREVTFELLADRLEVRHDGRPFTTADVRGVCGVGQGTKTGDLTQIGKFGIGFKSVYAYTSTPLVVSGEERFEIRQIVRPYAVSPAVWVGPPAAGAGQPERHVVLSTRRGQRRTSARWLVWSRPLGALGEPGLRIEVAFPLRAELDARHLTRREHSPLVVYFPTEKQTGLGFLISGPYRTTPARDNVPEHDGWNQALVTETAILLAEILAELAGQDLLTVDVWLALPLDQALFPADSLFRPLFDSVRAATFAGRIIPDDTGRYEGPAELRLTASVGLRELLTPGQLGALSGSAEPVGFVAGSVTAEGTPLLWHYLRDEIGVAEVTPAGAVAALTAEFLAAQPDDWIARLYHFLYQHQSLWPEPSPPAEVPVARERPIIRLTDGAQVLPFNGRGRPAAYLPGPVPTRFPTVRPAVAEDRGARRFLEALGFAEADVLAEAIDHVLPRYAEAEAESLDLAQHEADLEVLARALAQAPPTARDRLREQLQQTEFLVGENAADGQARLMLPGELYQRTPALETYFAGNQDAWFAADRYGPWRAQLRDFGVRESVRLDARAADELGHVAIAAEFARHERGLAGFDPAAHFDGLEYALAHPTASRSEFVWNGLLLPYKYLIVGVVESSPRQGFADAKREKLRSRIGELVTAAAWLPAADGSFRPPAEVDLADLPATFGRDEGLAHALGMTDPVIDEANRQLGFPPDFLRRLAAHPDLVDLVERELRGRESGAGPGLLRLL